MPVEAVVVAGVVVARDEAVADDCELATASHWPVAEADDVVDAAMLVVVVAAAVARKWVAVACWVHRAPETWAIWTDFDSVRRFS